MVWGPWYKVQEVWTPRDKDAIYTITFNSLQAISYDIEIAHGYDKKLIAREFAVGSLSVQVRLPKNIVTALHVRLKSHTVPGSAVDVRVFG